MSQGERRLSAIMFTDMVGYTSLGQRNESLALAVVDEQRGLIRPILVRHRGREVKTIGDAFLVEFPNAVDAVRCAYDIQRAARELNLSLPAESRIHLRVGIHVGEVVESQGDISGDAVNVASRVESMAEDGGVCLTRQVYDHVHNKVDLPLTSMGPVALKNVEEPAEIFRMEMPWGAAPAPAPKPDRRRIAVLPFASLSPDPNDEFFADGLTEELITKLSEVKGLRVIARTSVMNYKKREKSVSQIGKELTVGSLIEGSVRKAGNRVRITAQLIDTQNEEHLWASTYDRELDDIFTIQSDVAVRVADSLKAGVLSGPEKEETGDVRAYMLYLRAVQLIHESDEPGLREAVTLLEQAVARDPNFAKAHAALAGAWGRLVTGGYEDFTEGVAKAEKSARTAVETGPEWAESHAALARVHTYLDQFDRASEELEKTLEINPNLAEAHTQAGLAHTTFGRNDQAIASFKRAYELDPLRVGAADLLAMALMSAGRTEEALDILERMKELYPRNPRIYSGLSGCHALSGDLDGAKDILDEWGKINPDEPRYHLDKGVLYALRGDEAEALKEREVTDKNKNEAVRLYGRLFISTALGDLDEAFKALSVQARKHSWPYNIAVDPLFKELRKDPRYHEFCVQVGIARPAADPT